MKNLKLLSLLSSLLLFFASSCVATEFDHEYIEQFAKNFIEENHDLPQSGRIDISPTKLDRRINIKPCSSPLSANIPENSYGRNVNIKITCNDSTPWHLFVPVKITTELPVVVATMLIDKGSVLSEDNLAIKYVDSNNIRGEVLDSMDEIVGAKAKRNIARGRTVYAKNICLVCSGENVTIKASSGSFSVKATGVAVSSGSLGDQVRVRNTRSGKVVSGRVSAINYVEITL
ncbi:flagellar basal body P-ring formation protein FlgA [Thalassotalea sp. LPB0316]|uniref:flagellar basal body P-ring formation chaperone FlgA n=1 Tax=Thalassotalea sp. LPB0316 TaxID=2769490 RepID=UPI00186611E9|nr:flagellar basal body P-ring formation chaperone FlgA [Thalassotalea sp. LPB0316]QOL27058.1 flagellar basal body P-ring formation protein FlgA [Thalassotalea sp. LPB0316]